MKAGTIIKLPDNRIGTVVYNGLDGEGIKWGRHNIIRDNLVGNGNTTHGKEIAPKDYKYFPDAMLRELYPLAIQEGIKCVGENYEIIYVPE